MLSLNIETSTQIFLKERSQKSGVLTQSGNNSRQNGLV